MYTVNARNIHTPNVIVGMAAFSGGLAQFMAGMWAFPRGDVFAATSACFRHLHLHPIMWFSYRGDHFVGHMTRMQYFTNVIYPLWICHHNFIFG
jgi:succinate-acetate transporter protein